VDFADAAAALQDPNNRTIADPDSQGETRWITPGKPWRSAPLLRSMTMRDEYDFSQGKPSAQVPALARLQREAEGKERITIRIDADVLAWFRARVAGGGSYQALINDTLRAAMLNDDAPLTVARLREVLRAELRSAT